MQLKVLSCIFISVLFYIPLFGQKKIPKNKQAAIKAVESHKDELINISNQIWELAETALKEKNSSNVLSDYAAKQGFKVTKNVAGMPTAFIAEYGSGKPIIGILGEFDALPGISQKASSKKEPLKIGGAGHGCGHNLFGAGSIGAAVAIKELIENGKLKGTIRFYGTPAEESVGGKIYMAREGLFNDLDVSLDWHPSNETKANVQSSQALMDFSVEFFGKAAHAAYDPWNGKSALDGAELFTNGVNFYREHIRPTSRIHYVISSGGDVPNVIPEYAKVWIWVRDSKRSVIQEMYERMEQMAKGAALMADVDYKVSLNSGDHELLVNRKGGYALHKNLSLLPPITYSQDEVVFAKEIQKATGKAETGLDAKVKPFELTKEHPSGGSTDVGDVSWVVPQISLVVNTAPMDTPWHSWAVVACSGMSIGHKGMLYAAKALSMTMIDLFEDENLRNEIKAEFKKKKGDYVFKAMLPDGPPPIPEEK